jgi:hypothetical protein
VAQISALETPSPRHLAPLRSRRLRNVGVVCWRLLPNRGVCDIFIICPVTFVNAMTLGFSRQAALKRLRRNITLANVLAGNSRAPVSVEDLYLYLKHVVRQMFRCCAPDPFTGELLAGILRRKPAISSVVSGLPNAVL